MTYERIFPTSAKTTPLTNYRGIMSTSMKRMPSSDGFERNLTIGYKPGFALLRTRT
jgi:hypothetical protein